MPRPLHEQPARQMYEMYQQGYSLEQVGMAWGVTRQSIYDTFSRRGYRLRERKFLPTVEYRGERYAPDPYGYYRKTRGDRTWLHQVVWIDNNGPIPPDHEIHHVDRDKTNNGPTNLVCLTPSAHAQIHQTLHEIPEQHCIWCGSQLVRKRGPSGHLETPAALKRRQYCGTQCHSAHKRGRPRGWSARHEHPAGSL